MKLSSFLVFASVSLCAFLVAVTAGHPPVVYAYSDTDGYVFETAADYLTEQGIIGGYLDGSLKPNDPINRAEFLKLVMVAGGQTLAGSSCFTDVNAEWFASYVCAASEAQIVGGYSDGSFGPENPITVVEALKIVTRALEVQTQDPVGHEWYSEYLETFASKNFIPATLDYYSETLMRGEAFELMWRVLTDNETQDATNLEEFKGQSCSDFIPESYSNIDMYRVRETWLSWYNTARATHSLAPYLYDSQLDRTAYTWSVTSRERGYMDHKRPGTTAYYDYYAIQDWFENLGLTFQSVGGYSFTENIGHGPYSCSADDCTDELIAAIKYTFDYYMSEARSSYSPHYNSIMNSEFQKIGFGLVVDDGSYYMTIHYATEITSDPVPFCD